MLNFNRKKALTLLALSLLATSLLSANIRIPTVAQPDPEAVYLHGPQLKPIHMHSNITLTPIHMHHTRGILWPGEYPITQPNCTTDWYQIYPPEQDPPWDKWHLSSWEDLGEPIGELSQNDQIDMTHIDTQEVQWFHVDRMTLTLNLSGPYPFPEHAPGHSTLLLELKQPYCNPYDPYIVLDPLGTVWHEVWPFYSSIYAITNWIDDPQNPNGMLDYTDAISFDQGLSWYHVEDIATDLILRWKMMDPIGTFWHELYPEFCEWYELTSWESYPDPYCDRISSKDKIDMFRFSDQTTRWYFVDRVTITINVTRAIDPRQWMMLELKTTYHEEMYHALKKPRGTLWHAVYPEDVYCTSFNLSHWDPMDPLWDNCNGVLDPCDYIELANMTDGSRDRYHIEDMAYDIILNEYITDPVCNDWTELYPNYGEVWHIQDFVDTNDDIWLSPCDNLTLSDPTGFSEDYHVEDVTLTLNLTILDIAGTGGPPFTPGDRVYLENLESLVDPWNYTWPRLYHPKIEPWDTKWTIVYPPDYFGYNYTLDEWFDNCNGVIDYCDTLALYSADQALIVHVDGIAVDITVKKITEEPPPQWYIKPPYPDYAPSGMPDFDQMQDGWFHPMIGWSWCGPVSVANSLWWFDSKYETNPIPPPAVIDNFALVQSYGAWDDHDVLNVDPLVNNLAWLMDTDGIRTGIPHTGTWWWDLEAGIGQYLIQQGMDTTFEVHHMEFPDFYWIEDEIERCQDVVLLLEFWNEIPTGGWERWYADPGGEGGHYVTCAGVNSSLVELLISDPWQDAYERGWIPRGRSPVPHTSPHIPEVHNDTQYVSHDAWTAVFSPSPYGISLWELAGYCQQTGFHGGLPPTWHAFITVAIATSPLEPDVHDVAVIDVTTSKAGCLPVETVAQGYTVRVNATVENQGNFAENFNVTAYANATAFGAQPVALNPGDNTTLTFIWDTRTWIKGNYSINVAATIVPGETDIADNNLNYGWMFVTIAGDVDADRDVDIFDIVRMASAYGVSRPHPIYDPNSDIDDDDDIDIFDIVAATANYGSSW